MYNSRMIAGRRKDWTQKEVAPTSPKIKEMEAKFSELRKNWKNAAAKCRDEIRKDVNTRQTTDRGATARLNLWKKKQCPSKVAKRDHTEQIMAGALLTSIARMRSAARQTTVESICADSQPHSPRALSLRLASPKGSSYRRSRFTRSTSLNREAGKFNFNSPDKPFSLSVLPLASSSSSSYRRSTWEEKSSTDISRHKQSSSESSPQRAFSLRLPSSPKQKRKVAPGKITMEIPLSEMIEGSTSSIMSSSRNSNVSAEAVSEKPWPESSQRLRSKLRAWPAVDSDDFIDIDLDIEDIPDVPR